jgi:hypothetical protein
MMCAPFDIYTLKLINIQFANFGQNIYSFVFSTKLGNTSCERIGFWKGKQLKDINAKLDAQTKDFPQITMAIHFSQLKGQGFEISFLHIIFFERILITNNLDIALLDTLGFFFANYISNFFFIGPLTSFSKNLSIKT